MMNFIRATTKRAQVTATPFRGHTVEWRSCVWLFGEQIWNATLRQFIFFELGLAWAYWAPLWQSNGRERRVAWIETASTIRKRSNSTFPSVTGHVTRYCSKHMNWLSEPKGATNLRISHDVKYVLFQHSSERVPSIIIWIREITPNSTYFTSENATRI